MWNSLIYLCATLFPSSTNANIMLSVIEINIQFRFDMHDSREMNKEFPGRQRRKISSV